jgi:hypothetical protein
MVIGCIIVWLALPMDDIVKQAMVKWPHVPDCYGWLGLDARGDWYMRDDQTQALGAFNSGVPGAKGSRLMHVKLIEFIQRNYQEDDAGQWYFQNGPQKVYVALALAPWVWRVQDSFAVLSHTGAVVQVDALYADEQGRAFLRTDKGFGVVHSQDMVHLANAVEAGLWTVTDAVYSDLVAQFRFVLNPQKS